MSKEPRGAPEDREERRFFVTISGTGKRAFMRLQSLDLDLFVPTLRRHDDDRVSMEGLLTMREIERLVDQGFAVTVEAPDSARSRAHEVIDFEEWRKGMEEDLGPIERG